MHPNVCNGSGHVEGEISGFVPSLFSLNKDVLKLFYHYYKSTCISGSEVGATPVKLFEQGFDEDPLIKRPIVNQSKNGFVKFEMLNYER